ncbi:MAG TPA: tyrosine--tRNA ligase [Acidimicrobiia bacterium]|nr:tyrosine--tRNA ligase [Acidimicrobiia bacterium]
MANPLDTLIERGFVQDASDRDALRDLLDEGPTTFYYGCDPTASSLHIGNLVGLMAMAWLQRSGHRAIALAGGGTGRIGDPSFRDDERQLLPEETITHNLERIREQMGRLIDIEDPSRGILVDNHDWLGTVGFLDFLRDVGKHFSVNQMIARESVRRRLEEREQGISFTEFSYQLLQAYDFAHLHAAEGCMLQIGGSDQWGNITAGIELTRRLHGARVHGFTWPLIERSDGKKISKSTNTDAPVLAADETSPYAFYQWFFNVPDADVDRFLRLFTFLPLDEIASLVAAGESDPSARTPQRTLAEEVTRIVHGEEGLDAARSASEILFGSEPFVGLDDRTIDDAFAAAPSVTLERSLLGSIGLLELMVRAGAAASNGEARRLVTQGAVRVNNAQVDEPTTIITESHLIGSDAVVIRTGKKSYHLARFR